MEGGIVGQVLHGSEARRILGGQDLELGENRHSAIVVHAPSHQLTRRHKNGPVVNENSGKGRRRKLPSSVECLAALVVQIVLSVRQVSLDACKHLPIDVVAAETKPALLQAVRHEGGQQRFFLISSRD